MRNAQELIARFGGDSHPFRFVSSIQQDFSSAQCKEMWYFLALYPLNPQRSVQPEHFLQAAWGTEFP